jgi:ribosomal protein L25 (general stress protein Ctc)
MDERAREDMIKAVSYCIEKNHCAIKRDDLFKKFKNTSRSDLQSIIDSMKRRKTLLYDEQTDKYRLVIK